MPALRLFTLLTVEELATLRRLSAAPGLLDPSTPGAARFAALLACLRRCKSSLACASSKNRRKSSLSSALVNAAEVEAFATDNDDGGGAAGKCEPEALRPLVLKLLRLEDMEVDCGIPRRVCVGEAEMRPEGAADVEAAVARSFVQAKGIVTQQSYMRVGLQASIVPLADRFDAEC